MTNNFDALYESLLSEVVVGSAKRNKPGMGRKGGKLRDINHVTSKPRRIKKHAAHIRPVGKSIGNETGKHSKNPNSKPVYSKSGVKPNKNRSQRSLKVKGNPYSSRHDEFGTQRKIADRREKLLKNMEEGKEKS